MARQAEAHGAGSVGMGPRVRFPDGQEVQAVIAGRRHEPDGAWWCDLLLPLWAHAELPTGQAGVEPFEVRFPMPMEQVERIDGQDYGAVPTLDAAAAPACGYRQPHRATLSDYAAELGTRAG